MKQDATKPSARIGIVGTGRVAQAVGRFLIERDQPVTAIAGRNRDNTARAAHFIGADVLPATIEDLPDLASHILIAVSDSAIEPVAALLAQSGFRRGIALHTCGAKGPQALEVLTRQGVNCGSLHPIQSFATVEQGVEPLAPSVVAIDGDPPALQWATEIVCLLGGRSIRICPEHRSLYHAATVIASNYLAVLIHTGVELMQSAGIERQTALSALAPLVRTSAENSLLLGPVEALTGPIQRGDSGTVLSHLNALKIHSEAAASLYGSAGRVALEMAKLRGLSADDAARIEVILA